MQHSKQMNLMSMFHAICDFGSRLSGSKSEADALDYVEGYFSNLPCGEVVTHRVSYPGWSSSDCWIEIDNKRFDAFALPRSGSFSNHSARVQVVDAGRGTPEELNALRASIAGKAVVVTHEFMFAPDHVHRMKKYECAQALGATAFIIANPDAATGRVSGSVHGTVPGFGVSAFTGDALRSAAQSGKHVQFHMKSAHTPASTRTIDWSIKGTDPEFSTEEIIVCAHLDGHESSENAMDNASGVAVIMALAKELCTVANFPHTVRILIFSAEEFGLCGSKAYVDKLSLEKRAAIRAVFNLDCVGGSTRFGAMTSAFAELKEEAERCAAQSEIPVCVHEPLLKNSDHYNFAVAGIPAMRLIAGFGDADSRLRHVLTEADMRAQVAQEDLVAALKLTHALIQSMSLRQTGKHKASQEAS
ncbi:M28 family metallopeptidase [Hoeflea prorocentri]|uniref:Carboxypeptidase Q n=1 Tax=Hoeflea prorocentri TaxID=1922333 RepID=A0A9X3ULA3_9HYPH|nr:M28 family metallopeptidase [Hoeflea prorocentri]MCY6382868.1 M28 family metallopeptidase [Hoeflea prorocentri]MDA5400668.1 M28 family metallopeptidase [Hoeflea prorocentri]